MTDKQKKPKWSHQPPITGPWKTYPPDDAMSRLAGLAKRRLQTAGGDVDLAQGAMLGDGSAEMNTIKHSLVPDDDDDKWAELIHTALVEASGSA